jgi:hypothetical protein
MPSSLATIRERIRFLIWPVLPSGQELHLPILSLQIIDSFLMVISVILIFQFSYPEDIAEAF